MDTLFFWASKLIWALISPDSLLLLLWSAGTCLLLLGAKGLAKKILCVASIFAIAVALLPLGESLYLPLERRFPPVANLPERVDGIIVLGGFLDNPRSDSWQQIQSNSAAERLWAFTQLARLYPEAQLLFTGGSGSLTGQGIKEADFLPELMDQAGLGSRDLLIESESRNTIENAIYSKRLAAPQPGAHWLLVTSAFHMPRAVGIFCAQQWSVQPYPVDYRADPDRLWRVELRFADHLQDLSNATREWVGLLAYYITGKTSSLLPDQSSDCVVSV